MRIVHWLFTVGALLFVLGIGFVVVGASEARQAPPPVEESVSLAPVASVRQIMNGIVNPGATAVFDSVTTDITDQGVVETVPETDAEWEALGDSAAAIAEAGNLIMMEGRLVDRGDWVTMSTAMIDAAKQTLDAVKAKNTDGVLDAGSALNLSCDNCHQRYRRQ
jgi:hypothetical protein